MVRAIITAAKILIGVDVTVFGWFLADNWLARAYGQHVNIDVHFPVLTLVYRHALTC
jgi:hypothetical protein